MILMIQKNRVTSGTLFSIVRPSDGAGAVMEFAFMAVHGGAPALRLPDRGQLEHEASARASDRDDVAPPPTGEPPRRGQAQPGAIARRARAANAGLEGAV